VPDTMCECPLARYLTVVMDQAIGVGGSVWHRAEPDGEMYELPVWACEFTLKVDVRCHGVVTKE
jgi:hypothetical protein